MAATLYRAITGQTPLEAIDRMAQDDLQPPSQLGVKIDKPLEKNLFKALAVKTEGRYQAVEEFQKGLVTAGGKSRGGETPVGAGPKQPSEPVGAEVKASEVGLKEKAQAGVQAEPAKDPEKKPEPAEEQAGRVPQEAPAYSVSKRTVKAAALVLLGGLLVFGAVSLFGGGDEADYYIIDYENGIIPLGDLPIGARVVDPSWEWEFRTGSGYARESGDVTKSVTWIVVAKDHYEGLVPPVTLLSEELIGFFPFDNSTNRGSKWGSNQ